MYPVYFRLMKESSDVPAEFRTALSQIDYRSPVCKINVAINRYLYKSF